MVAVILVACNKPETEPAFEFASPNEFVKGADISWVTEQEQDGIKFYNTAGMETDCFAIMREIGMTAIRLRVWVDPVYGLCDKADVLLKARRAQQQGLNLMIDFHYSDWFADPARQDVPAAWKNYTFDQLKEAVAMHTNDILSSLKEANITPVWIQIGNETRNGMLWPYGKLWDENGDIENGWKNYTALHNAGYDAAKSIFPESIIIVHIDNAWEDNNWWFKNFKNANGKFDMIGLSHYPQTNPDKDWQEMNRLAVEHIQSLANNYNCKIMVCEVGTKQNNEALAAQILQEFINEIKQIENCAGVFYWEPQVYGQWKPASYNILGWNAYDMGAFTSTGQPAAALAAFK